jgi:hypothetical protein
LTLGILVLRKMFTQQYEPNRDTQLNNIFCNPVSILCSFMLSVNMLSVIMLSVMVFLTKLCFEDSCFIMTDKNLAPNNDSNDFLRKPVLLMNKA